METIKTTCVDCQSPFEITPGEQKFFQEKGFTLPKRCATCRRKKRLEREAQGGDN